MPLLLVLLQFVIPALIVVLAIASWRLNGQLFDLLRNRHSQLWLDLGKPARLKPLSGRFLYWVWSRGFDNLEDVEVAKLGSKIIGANVLAIAIVVIWAACAWWGGYLHAW